MQFNANEWRRFYDKIQAMGQMLKDSYPSIDENKEVQPPKKALRKIKQDSLKEEIKKQTEKCIRYLNWSGKKLTPPLWAYNVEDKTTWASDPSFKYGHLLKLKRKFR